MELFVPARRAPFEVSPGIKEQIINSYSNYQPVKLIVGMMLWSSDILELVENILEGDEFATKAWSARAAIAGTPDEAEMV